MAPMDSVAQLMSPKKYSVLFVCLGNICRSPALMGELRRQAEKRGLTDQLLIDSCAMTAWHVGEPPDPRMCKAAATRGLKLEHKAKLFLKEYFTTFDLILAVNREVLQLLDQAAQHARVTAKILLATSFSKQFKDQDIPDPYYDVERAFDHTMDMSEDCSTGILDHLFGSR